MYIMLRSKIYEDKIPSTTNVASNAALDAK